MARGIGAAADERPGGGDRDAGSVVDRRVDAVSCTSTTHHTGCECHEARRDAEIAELKLRYENRGHLMDAYIRALAEISDGVKNPIQFARKVLASVSADLIEVEKQYKKEEGKK